MAHIIEMSLWYVSYDRCKNMNFILVTGLVKKSHLLSIYLKSNESTSVCSLFFLTVHLIDFSLDGCISVNLRKSS